MRKQLPNKLFIPAIAILCTVSIMVIFIAWSTHMNLDRDRLNALKFLIREGETIVHAITIEAGALATLNPLSENNLVPMIQRILKKGTVSYGYFENASGNVMCGALPYTQKTSKTIIEVLGENDRIVQFPGSQLSFEIRRPFGIPENGFPRDPSVMTADKAVTATTPAAQGVSIVLGLSMKDYETARRADLQHAAVMVIILVCLGGSSLFFLVVIRNYLRDFARMQRFKEKSIINEKYAAIGKLSASVAHEIRNPLGSIRGFAQFLSHLLRDKPEDREYATVIVNEVDRINRVITELLNYSKPMEPVKKAVMPDSLITYTVKLIWSEASSRDIQIHTVVAPKLPELTVDPNLMTNVLLNLSLNALRELEKGGVLTLGVTHEKKQRAVRIWVEDEGPGIPEVYQKQIFDPFFTKRVNGTGLGLAIAKNIIEKHDGTIDVISPLPGRTDGCRFTITLPDKITG